MRRFALLCLLALPFSLAAQDTLQKFHYSIKPANISGTDTYTITKTETGYRVAGTSQMTSARGPIVMNHTEVLGPSWDLKEYRFSAQVGGQAQNVDVLRKGDTITMTADTGGQFIPKDVAWKPNTIVLDNFIAAHYQVLLNVLADQNPTAATQWQLIVPQRLNAGMGTIDSKTDTATGTLDGKPIALKTYSVELGGSLIQVTADTATNQLMRVQVPLQQFDMTRDGFIEEEKTSPAATNCTEKDATFSSGTLKVPATLCTPKSVRPGEKFPIVVMVHGSGPHDRDETIGPNKPFKDIAEGLAANGIGSLRYEKRTYFAKNSFSSASTVEEETIADAVAALKAAGGEPGVDPKRVFLLGHSLGGMMAPYIVERAPETRGVILMSAAAVPLDETIERQIAAQLKATGASQADIDKQVAEMKQRFADIRSGKTTGDVKVLGAPAHYWADLFQRDVSTELKKMKQPVLVLQGGKDIQVVKADYDLIQHALAGKQAEFKWFPSLNHLMMKVEGPSTGAEYGKFGHVDAEVIQVITAWIANQK